MTSRKRTARQPRAPENDRSIPADLARAVGVLVITGATVDAHVALQIIRMISPAHFVSWHAWPVVAGMDFKVKLAMIRSLASHHDDATRDCIVECCDELQTFYSKRNLVAHAVTHGKATKDGRHSFMFMMPDNKKGGMRSPTLVRPDQIEEWGRQLFMWSNELDQSLTDLGYPRNPPTQDDVGEPLSEDEKEAHRWKNPIPRTNRKRPPPSALGSRRSESGAS